MQPNPPQPFRRTRSLRRVHTTFSLSGPQLETTYDDYSSPTFLPTSATSPQLSSSAPSCPTFARNAESLPSDMSDTAPKIRSSFRKKMSRSFSSFRKLRKRENASIDDEESGGGGACISEIPNAVVVLDTANSDCQVADFEISEKRRGVWQKTVHSMMLRLKGQEQHKDVYVMPDALREQLKQVYVY